MRTRTDSASRLLGTTLSLFFLLSACRPNGTGPDPGMITEEDQSEPVEIDIEPNNDPESATPLGRGGTGHLGQHDIDYYQTEGAPELWRLSVVSEEPEALRVDVIQTGGGGRLQETLISRTAILAGRSGADLLVVIRPVGGVDVDYMVSVEPLDLPDVGQLLSEPNDHQNRASLTSIPGRVAGFYDGPEDRDVIRVETRLLRNRNATTIEVAPIAGIRPTLTVFGPDHSVLVEVTAELPGLGVGIPNLGPPGSQEYVDIEIRDANDGQSSSPYTVSFHSPSVVGDLLELEPNGSAEYAGRLRRRSVVTGFLHSADDIDNFIIPISSETPISVVLVPDEGTDATLSWTPQGGLPQLMDSNGLGADEAICSRVTTEGDLRLEIGARSVTGEGLHTYTLTTRVERGSVEREPNGMTNLDELMVVSTGVEGYIYPAGDVDVYSWRVISAIDAQPRRRVEVDPPSGVDVELEVLDDAGDRLAVANRGGAGDLERATLEQLPTGNYMIVVRGRAGRSCGDRYRLTLE